MRWIVAVGSLLILVGAASASELFRIGEVEGVLNASVGYGILARVEDRDAALVGSGNGGTAPSVNFDDGNLNYDPGIVANELRATGEIALRWGHLGAFVRGYGFYDFETEHGGGRRTELGDEGSRTVGAGGDVQDAYVAAEFRLADVPVQLRVGKQLVNWGDGNFLRFGIDIVNPVDLVALAQPATTLRDVFVRQGMVWGVANLTETLAVEAFYQFDWQPVGLPPVGWVFSADDLVGVDVNFAMEGFGAFSDRGTDLDAAFGPTNQPLGFQPDFMKIFPAGIDEPDDQGQFGFAVQTFLPILNSSKLSMYFASYHSRLPLVNGATADAAAVSDTTDAAVDARQATFGVSRSDAELLTISDLANATRYEVVHPEDLRMLGVSFSTATVSTGTLIAAEVSHHFNWPVQVPKEEVLVAALSPVLFTSPLADAFRSTSLGTFGPGQRVKGWFDTAKTQTSLSVAQLLGPRLGGTQSLLSADIGWVHIDELPGSSPFDEHSWGYRLTGSVTYEGVLGGFTVRPALVWTHDVGGVTPGPGGAFVEGRKTLTAAIDVQYTQRWTASVAYGLNLGGAPFNLLEDRDFVRFNLIFHY